MIEGRPMARGSKLLVAIREVSDENGLLPRLPLEV